MIEPIPQWQLFLTFLFLGYISSIFLEVNMLINTLCKNKKIIEIIMDIISILCITITYIFFINILNYGENRMFLLISFILGIFLERKSIGKLFAKLYRKLYNYIVYKVKNISKSKFIQFLKR